MIINNDGNSIYHTETINFVSYLPIYMMFWLGNKTTPLVYLGDGAPTKLPSLQLRLIVSKIDMSFTFPFVAGAYPPHKYIFPVLSIIPVTPFFLSGGAPIIFGILHNSLFGSKV